MPFEYRVRHSPRAKHVRVKVSPYDGVVVVVPRGFDTSELPALIERQRAWIARQLARIGDAAGRRDELPRAVDLQASDERWNVDYAPNAFSSVRVTQSMTLGLRVSGGLDDPAPVRAALRRWLARRARAHLVGRLDELSTAFGLPYARASIRFQRSRWGSCSSNGTISLNARLMFLPDRLVRCVLTHELCHTVHMNHGPGFRRLLGGLEPGHETIRHELRDGWRRVPGWALA